jgi:DNA mismatch repair protein MutS
MSWICNFLHNPSENINQIKRNIRFVSRLRNSRSRINPMTSDDVTPVRQQYLDTKRQYQDCILLFRLGDFYETFDEDAETVSRELDIVLTSRPIGKGMRAPLAGIPYHALDNYLVRLIEKGYHVAIAEQMGDQPTKGIFPRKVVRVVTPGTLIEPSLLPGDANNYLVAVVIDGSSGSSTAGQATSRAAVAYADITTGEFAVTELDIADGSPLRAELTRLRPAEIIHPDNITLTPYHLPLGEGRRGEGGGHATPVPAWRFELGRSTESLLKHFNTTSLEGFGLKNAPFAIRAAGAILQYLKETEPASLSLLTSLRYYSLNEFMTLDAATRRNLELTETLRGEIKGSLLGVLDDTITPMGKRLLRQWVSQPLLDLSKILNRQNGVEFFFSTGMLRAELRAELKPLADLERLTNRILSGHAQPRDLVALRETLKRIPAISAVLPPGAAPILTTLSLLSPCSEALSLLEAAIADDPPATTQNTGMIRPGYSAELDGVIDASAHARDWINNLEAIERDRTGIKTLKVGYNKVFGYYIEISAGQAANAPSNYIRKQTLVNAERYITPEMNRVAPVQGSLRHAIKIDPATAQHSPRPGRTGLSLRAG